MDGSRFDDLTRSLAASPSRRRLLGAAIGSALSALGIGGRVEAKPPVDCPPGDLCNGECCVPHVEACCAGVCVEVEVVKTECNHCGRRCPTGEHCCGQTCKNLSTDEANCGACGNACPAGATCVDGKCKCPKGYLACHGKCVRNDVHNCGRCGNTCTAGDACIHGACVCNSTVICKSGNRTHTILAADCTPPKHSVCCGDSMPGAHDGFAVCCTPGVDCPVPVTDSLGRVGDISCPNGALGAIGQTLTGNVGYNTTCGVYTSVSCVAEGQPCAKDWSCCGTDHGQYGGRGICLDNVCHCRPLKTACASGLDCCSGTCRNGACGTCSKKGKACGSDVQCCAGLACGGGNFCIRVEA